MGLHRAGFDIAGPNICEVLITNRLDGAGQDIIALPLRGAGQDSPFARSLVLGDQPRESTFAGRPRGIYDVPGQRLIISKHKFFAAVIIGQAHARAALTAEIPV